MQDSGESSHAVDHRRVSPRQFGQLWLAIPAGDRSAEGSVQGLAVERALEVLIQNAGPCITDS